PQPRRSRRDCDPRRLGDGVTPPSCGGDACGRPVWAQCLPDTGRPQGSPPGSPLQRVGRKGLALKNRQPIPYRFPMTPFFRNKPDLSDNQTPDNDQPSAAMASLDAVSSGIAALVDRVGPAVVRVETT